MLQAIRREPLAQQRLPERARVERDVALARGRDGEDDEGGVPQGVLRAEVNRLGGGGGAQHGTYEVDGVHGGDGRVEAEALRRAAEQLGGVLAGACLRAVEDEGAAGGGGVDGHGWDLWEADARMDGCRQFDMLARSRHTISELVGLVSNQSGTQVTRSDQKCFLDGQ